MGAVVRPTTAQQFRPTRYGLGFLCAWIYSSFFSFALAPGAGSRAEQTNMLLWLLFLVGVMAGVGALLVLERTRGEVGRTAAVQGAAAACMTAGTAAALFGFFAPEPFGYVVRGSGQFAAGVGMVPLSVAWVATFAAASADEAEKIIPASTFLATVLTVLVCAAGGWLADAAMIAFPAVSFAMLRRECVLLGLDGVPDPAEGAPRGLASGAQGGAFALTWRTVVALAAFWGSFTLLRASVSPDGSGALSTQFATTFTVGAIAAACITYAFLCFAKRMTFFSMLRFAFPLTCASLLLFLVSSPQYTSMAFAVSFVAALCLEIIVWVALAALVRDGRQSCTSAVGWFTFAMQAGPFAVILVLLLVPTASIGFMVSGVLVVLAAAVMIVMPDSSAARQPDAVPVPQTTESVYERRCDRLAAQHGLSPREREVLLLLGKGRDVPYIRDELYISRNTVNSHIKNIYRKLGIHSKQELLDLVELP